MGTSTENSPSGRKLALIIGNDDYCELKNRLNHSVNNANSLHDALREIGFDVEIHPNPRTSIMDLVVNFAQKVTEGDLVLFYFSGHGCQMNGKNFLIPVDDALIEKNADIDEFGFNFNRILERLTENNRSYITIAILDCCTPYVLKNEPVATTTPDSQGLLEIQPTPGVFIQFSCAAKQTVSNLHERDGHCLFGKHLLKTITNRKFNIGEVFRRISDSVYQESQHKQKPLSTDGLKELSKVCLVEKISVIPNIPHDAIWAMHAQTIAGGSARGPKLNKLYGPKGLHMDENQTIFFVDGSNHRIMKYAREATVGRKVFGRGISGSGPDLLWEPSDIVFDHDSNSLIISDSHNRRVLRCRGRKNTETLIDDISCGGLAIDDEGFLYVSDTEHHEVRRYPAGSCYGTVVAGGNGQGSRLSQLNHPTYICVGPDQAVYISDVWNDRIVKWCKGATHGIVVAGGKRKGRDRTQLDGPAGLIVDQQGAVYVADQKNHRVMRFYKGASHGEIIAGDKYVVGNSANKLNEPAGLAFDSYGNLYVADSNNHRIQRFDIQTT